MLPKVQDEHAFRLRTFLNVEKAKVPATHDRKLGRDWAMLGNDRYGDCVFAGAAHETMMWNAERGAQVGFDDHAVLSDYSAVTGFNPNDPNSDQGTDMSDAASYRRKVGIVDTNGQRHQIAAYLAITPGSISELYQAMYLFGAVGIGIEFPASAMDQFNSGKVWSVRRSVIEGGHYVPMVAKRSHVECVTWGRVQPMTLGFYEKYCDEALAYVSAEALVNNRSPEGFDSDTLLADLQALGG